MAPSQIIQSGSLDRRLGRREFLRRGMLGASLLAGESLVASCGDATSAPGSSNIARLGPLGEPDENGVRLPAGFTSRIVATSTQTVANSGYVWHHRPDGAAVFPTADGGWILVSNSEVPGTGGGAGAIRFDAGGAIVDAYPILQGTNFNCAGGPTPWGTWLSCEEDFGGKGAVWECEPGGQTAAVRRSALGLLTHEAVAVDSVGEQVFMTEDQPDGGFYRFCPDAYPDLDTGTLEIARVEDLAAVHAGDESRVDWLRVPDPSAASGLTRRQLAESTAFNGGEGIWLRGDTVYYATKGDNRVYVYDARRDTLCLFYEAERDGGLLTGVDNVTIADGGEVLVAEDGGNMELVVLVPGDRACALSRVFPIAQVTGQHNSEIAGPVFDPSGTRLYLSSQTGRSSDFLGMGITYEISGPFRS